MDIIGESGIRVLDHGGVGDKRVVTDVEDYRLVRIVSERGHIDNDAGIVNWLCDNDPKVGSERPARGGHQQGFTALHRALVTEQRPGFLAHPEAPQSPIQFCRRL